MGFECGFVKMPRCGDTTGQEVEIIQAYLRWRKNKNNISFESYSGFKEDEIPSIEKINYYSGFIHKTEYDNETIIDTIDYWGSVGRKFNNWFIETLNGGMDDCRLHDELTPNTIKMALAYVRGYLDSKRLTPWRVVNAYREDPTSGETTLIPCTGIELENEDGLRKRINTEYEEIYYSLEYCEDDEREAFIRLEKVLQNLLETVDFNKEMVYYFTSW